MEWPKCEYRLEYPKEKCVNGRRWRWCKLPVPYGSDLPDKYEWQDRGPCPKCNGTGERGLTADEAAEHISQSYFMGERIWTFYIWFCRVSAKGGCWNFDFYTEKDTYSHREFKNITDSRAITEAANAAARAVRRQGCAN